MATISARKAKCIDRCKEKTDALATIFQELQQKINDHSSELQSLPHLDGELLHFEDQYRQSYNAAAQHIIAVHDYINDMRNVLIDTTEQAFSANSGAGSSANAGGNASVGVSANGGGNPGISANVGGNTGAGLNTSIGGIVSNAVSTNVGGNTGVGGNHSGQHGQNNGGGS